MIQENNNGTPEKIPESTITEEESRIKQAFMDRAWNEI